jgi:hypothetical protein
MLKLIRPLVIIVIAYASFKIGKKVQKEEFEGIPQWGTIFCGNNQCKKELGPVFYTENQCKIVIKALQELDTKERKCIKLLK